MNLGLHGEIPAMKPEPATKSRRTSVTELDGESNKLLVLVAKLCLNSAQQVRLLRSVLLEAFMVPVENPFLAKMLRETKQFTERAKSVREHLEEQGIPKAKIQDKVQDSLGLPHIHAFSALIEVALATLQKEPEANKQSIDVLTGYCADYQAKGWRAISQEVKAAMKEKAYGKENMKLLVNVQPETKSHQVWSIIKQLLLAQKGVRELQAVAPKGNMERQIQEWLERNGHSSSES